MGGKMPEPGEMTVTVTVVQMGKPDIQLLCPGEGRSVLKSAIYEQKYLDPTFSPRVSTNKKNRFAQEEPI